MATIQQTLPLINKPAKPARAWAVVVTASLFFFYGFVQLGALNVISTPLMAEFGLKATYISGISSIYLWSNTLMLLPAGLILDRYPVRQVALITLSFMVLGVFGFAFTHSPFMLGFYRFLSGIGYAFAFLISVILARRWFPPKTQGLVIGVIVTIAMLGGTLAQTPLDLLVQHYGWREAIGMDGLLGLIIFALTWFIVADPPKTEQQNTATQGAHLNFKASFILAAKNMQNWMAGLYTCLLNLPIMILTALWGTLYLTKLHGITETQASLVTSMILIGTIIGSPIVGFISDRLGSRKLPMIVGALLSLSAIGLCVFNPHASFSTLMALFFAVGLFTSTQVITYPLIAESNSPKITGVATAIGSTVIIGGAALAQDLFGYLMDAHHATTATNHITYTAQNLENAFYILPIAFIVALLASFLIKETNCQSQDRTHTQSV